MTKNTTSPSPDSFHIGKLIKAELRRQGRSITWLAEEVHCTRENLYKIFRRSWISTDMLFKISIVLKHDFFKDCSIWLGQGLVTDTRLLETMHKKEKHTTRDG